MDIDRRESDSLAHAGPGHSDTADDYQSLPQQLAVMPKNFPAGFRIPAHSHPRDQLIFALQGVMRVSTEAETWVVPPDRALLVPAGLEHAVEMRGDVAMRTLYLSPSAPARTKILAVSPLLRELIASLAAEPMNISGSQRAQLIARLIALEMDRADALPLNMPLPRDQRLQSLCLRLMDDPATAGSLEHLAGQFGASARTFSRLCRSELGMGFAEWRRRIRFAHAIELLERGASVKEVAARCGYASTSAFTHAFKGEFGQLPSDFL